MTKISNQYSLTNVLFADAVNGRVGIGTATPSSLFHINASGYPAITIQGGSTAGGGLKFLAGSDTYAEIFGEYESANNGLLLFRTRSAGTIVERLRITSSGNVGIGLVPGSWNTTYKAIQLKDATSMAMWSGGYDANVSSNTIATTLGGAVYGGASYGAAKYSQFDGGHYWYSASAGTAGGTISFAERMRITSSGNVGIGTTAPTAFSGYTTLTIDNTSGSFTEYRQAGSNTFRVGSNESNGGFLYTQGSTPIRFGTIDTERMRITSGGSVCVNTTTASFSSTNRGNITIGGSSGAIYALQTGGVDRAYVYHDGSNYSINSVNAGGNIYMSSVSGGVIMSANATSWASNSDERLKNINSNIEDAVSKLSSLRAVNFSWKSDETQKEVLGLIAQDVEKSFPQVIDKNKLPAGIDRKQLDETEYLSVRYTELIPVLVKAIQELSAQASEQQTQINELKALLNAQ